MVESWDSMMEPETKPSLVDRWDWHAWQLFAALVPSFSEMLICPSCKANPLGNRNMKRADELLYRILSPQYRVFETGDSPVVILGLANYADREMERRNALIAAAKVRVVPDATGSCHSQSRLQ